MKKACKKPQRTQSTKAKITFVDSTIRPLCEMIEKAFNHRLLNEIEQENYYFKFNLAGLLRGDMKSRFEAYNIGRNIGVYSANDIRKLEDLNEIENGDIYLQPLNMDEAGSPENSASLNFLNFLNFRLNGKKVGMRML